MCAQKYGSHLIHAMLYIVVCHFFTLSPLNAVITSCFAFSFMSTSGIFVHIKFVSGEHLFSLHWLSDLRCIATCFNEIIIITDVPWFLASVPCGRECCARNSNVNENRCSQILMLSFCTIECTLTPYLFILSAPVAYYSSHVFGFIASVGVSTWILNVYH